MINRINASMNYYKLERTLKSGHVEKASKLNLKSDINDIKSKEINVEQIYFKEGVTHEMFEEIRDKFNILVQANSLSGTSVAAYDVSEYAAEFPYEMTPEETLSLIHKGQEHVQYQFHFKFPESDTKLSIRVHLTNKANDLEVLDANTFENVVIKAALIACERVKLHKANGLLTLHHSNRRIEGIDHNINIKYDPLTKTADFEELKRQLYEGYDWLIDKDFPENMPNEFITLHNLDIDPSIVKDTRRQLSFIFDEIMKMFSDESE